MYGMKCLGIGSIQEFKVFRFDFGADGHDVRYDDDDLTAAFTGDLNEDPFDAV
jgi:hypothetical protein